ncbi:hypothetical protein [endosymbiont GvMRE of Glomus versiforme]|uniref:hypothetical protein n=1 Tax=endosymbiont GvMRE of Glomus versiforme TaxID=2039283 RepID=UPI0011C36AC6|nr:hypothetical protein [endosymbiont GvMRE of Glomus versiforme]
MLKEKVVDIGKQLKEKKETISLSEIKELCEEVGSRYTRAKEREKTEEVDLQISEIFLDVIDIVFKTANEWKTKKIFLTNEELNLLDGLLENEMTGIFQWLDDNPLPKIKDSNFLQETNKNRKEIMQSIQKEKTHLLHQQKTKKDNKKQLVNYQKSREFNWLYIAIPLGAITIILGIIIAYLLGKKRIQDIYTHMRRLEFNHGFFTYKYILWYTKKKLYITPQ